MRSKRIVVADDSLTLRAFVRKTLVDAGYTDISIATDGDEAIEKIEANRPDLAILDINMPGTDGFAVMEHLKTIGAPWDAIPIILITRDESVAIKTLGARVGAFLHKPVSPQLLAETVHNVLNSNGTKTGVCMTS